MKINGMRKFQEGEDLEQFVDTFEASMRQWEEPKEEWVEHLSHQLSGTYQSTLRDLQAELGPDYDGLKAALFRAAGLSAQTAAISLLDLKTTGIANMNVAQLLQKVRRLRKRWSPTEAKESRFITLQGVILWMMPKRARVFLLSRRIDTIESLTEALQLYIQQFGSFMDAQQHR